MTCTRGKEKNLEKCFNREKFKVSILAVYNLYTSFKIFQFYINQSLPEFAKGSCHLHYQYTKNKEMPNKV